MGDYRNVVGSNLNFSKKGWITTYDKNFKKISERADR